MTICTYYDPLFTPRHREDKELIAMWRESWERNGWTTRVLSQGDAEAYPHFERFRKAVASKPTINDTHYEQRCFWRHCAFATSGADLFSDYDVICYDWRPDPKDWRFGSKIFSFLNGGPAIYTANKEGFEWLIDALEQFKVYQLIDGKQHISDMTAFLSFPIPKSWDCQDYPNEGWTTADVCHYGNEHLRKILPGLTKAQKIRELEKQRHAVL